VEVLAEHQRRLAAYAERNVAVVAGEAGAAPTRLFLIRRGCLVHALPLTPPPAEPELRAALVDAYAAARQAGAVERDEVDDMVILDAWLRRHRANLREVPVDPADPPASLAALAAALAA
jgi:hypothetical protein